ncbi:MULTISPECIES: 2-hydroxyacid dehydrogenase [Mesorhizobium]|uniref:Oxidoreductase n=2 Tax=Mesorhizobium TaxID=68287 RepID=A0A1A5HWW3_RHILI|nr:MULTISPECIES: 2-hydroxyacid dehydrogenase [Mesorhizobium]ETA71758.1 phosphoglycerate dehydrogenase-like oxidoreductase [Mesorhizobium japonicum R7A]MBE1708596.1 2-hydroxyacid dehydrogenase [Mesorhizobium japonicum]MBE1713765.1 2-hydroxyacid dehydrogenase [Mesorhizobium japonicum]MUT19915.1 oxidoreductase [Mesorhizobium japonicum]MUT25885.1 oxidoreductase [Mesorhizobium japonicum]
MRKRIAIIGDNFMLPQVFRAKIEKVATGDLDIRTLQTAWPDEPMEFGNPALGLDKVKEYFGHPDEVVDFIGDAEILVTQLAPLSEAMMRRLPALKLVAVSRGGPINIDMAAARAHGITVVNVPGRNATAVAEFTLGAILAETRLIRVGHEALRKGEWRGDLYRADRTGRELSEMTVGVIGYGNIGTKVVRLLRAFGCHVLVSDPYVQLSAEDRNAGVELVALDNLLARSDVVTLHPRVTEETRGLIGKDTIALMKPGVILINTARGPLVDYDALYEALVSGQIASAMLETFAVEPVPSDWPLLQLPNVTLTPHIAGASVRTVTYAAEQAAEEVRRYLTGLPPVNPC